MLASQDNAKQSKRSTTQEQVKKITPGCYTLEIKGILLFYQIAFLCIIRCEKRKHYSRERGNPRLEKPISQRS